jgi:hypothetical protein
MALTKGRIYGIRYRASNLIGWSSWSATSYIQAAKAPQAPPALVTTGTTSNSITLQINPTLEDNGAVVSNYKIYMDGGDLTTPITTLIHTGMGPTYIVTNSNHGVVSGKKYRFVSTAINTHGESLPS